MPVTPSRKITNIINRASSSTLKRDWGSEYQQLLNSNAPSSEYDKLLSDFLVANNIDEAKIEPFKDIFWTELTSSGGEGFSQTENPFIQFVQIMQDKWRQYIDRNKYGTIHNLYVDRTLRNEDLEGKSELRQDHIIFNPTLYQRPANEISRIVELFDKLNEGELERSVKDTKLEKLIKTTKTRNHLLKRIFTKGNGEVRSWVEIDEILSKIKKSKYKHATVDDEDVKKKPTLVLKDVNRINKKQFDSNENVQNILKSIKELSPNQRTSALSDLITYLNSMMK